MATKKRSKGGRATASRAKSTARPRTTTKAKTTPTPKKKAAKAKTVAKAKPVATAKRPPARTGAAKPVAGKAGPKAGAEHPALAALKSKFQRERSGLERRLTETVREIGVLRQHEMRAMHLERQLAERDATIGRLQTQLSELERRPVESTYVEVQQTFVLGAPAHEIEASATDVDEFEDDRIAEDADLVNDDE
jgi:hypothetical protein